MSATRPLSTIALLLAAVIALAAGPAALAADRDGGLARRPVLGASGADKDGHVVFTLVAPGGAAARAGLKAGDVIDAIGGRTIKTAADYLAAVRGQRPDTAVPFDIVRSGVRMTTPVVMPEAPREHGPGFETVYGAVRVGGDLRRSLLTLPNPPGRTRPPVVLLIGGIGCYSVDIATDANDPYVHLTQDLATRGIASLRIEKSGVGDSQGRPCSETDFQSESAAYAAGLEALGADPRVDPTHLYLLGHSIGTLIAPALAAKRPVAGVIVAEAVGRNWFEYELINLRRQLVLDGAAPAEVDARMASKERCMHRLLIERQDEAAIEQGEPDCKTRNAYPAPAAYMQQVAALNIAALWSALPPMPVLVIHGGADYIVDEADHHRIVDIVNTAHRGAAQFQEVPGMDHRFGLGGSQAETWQARVIKPVPLPYATALSDAVAGWVKARAAEGAKG